MIHAVAIFKTEHEAACFASNDRRLRVAEVPYAKRHLWEVRWLVYSLGAHPNWHEAGVATVPELEDSP